MSNKLEQFEENRRARIMRERKRKKKIRIMLSLIVLLAIIILIFIAIFAMNKNNTQNEPYTSTEVSTEATQEPYTEPDYGIPQAMEENDIMEILQNSGQQKVAYLTFDDGPTTNITPQVLDVLRRYNVKATFFMVGSLISANPDMARRVYEDGNLIANHSYAHNYDKLYANTDAFMEEINKCHEQLLSVIDSDDTLFKLMRFPGGSFNSSADSRAPVKQECKSVLAQNGYYYCDWNSLNGDAEGKTKNAQELFEYFKNSATGYNNVVVLMHDAATKQATVDALPSIIEYLLNEGYTFKTLDDIDYNIQNTAVIEQ